MDRRSGHTKTVNRSQTPSAGSGVWLIAMTLAAIGSFALLWSLSGEPGDTAPPIIAPLPKTVPPAPNAALPTMLPPMTPATPQDAAAASTRGMQLLATTGEGEAATATIADADGRRRTVKAGDTLESGGRVMAVEPTFMVVQVGDRQTKVVRH